MQDLPLNALRVFALVYKHCGVRAAARELRVAHSSVSRHLSELRRWAGVPLIRTTRGREALVFTPQGEALGKAVLASLRSIEHAAVALRETRTARSVVISTAPSFAVRWLLPRLPRLEAAHPRLEVSVVVDQRFVDLEDSGVDLALRMGGGEWRGVRAEPLLEDALYPVMSPALWKQSGRPSRPADLVRLRLLHDRDPNASWDAWRRACGPEALDVRKGPRFASSDLVLRAAVLGQGVALARHQLASDEVASGVLVRPFAGLSVALGPAYWIVLPDRGSVRPAVASVVRWLQSEAARST